MGRSFRVDGVFADLGRDDSGDGDGSAAKASQLRESRAGEMLAAVVKSGKETPQMRVPRRSRMLRYERELDAWFAELAAEEEREVDGSR